ncbi:hypothetical protein WDU94_000498 [Cyamophila willieti]
MSSYCRITGKSRGLPKPNYFPILPPISSSDAKRFCRITGKSYGLPTHHFLPVLLFSKNKKKKGKNTHETLGNKHRIVHGYRYVVPLIESSNVLMKLLENKTSDFLKINDLLHSNVTNIANKLVNKKKRKSKSKDLNSNGNNDLFSIFNNEAISDIYTKNLKDFQGMKESVFREMIGTLNPGRVQHFLSELETQIQVALQSNKEVEEIFRKYDKNKLSKTKIDPTSIDLNKLPTQLDINDIISNLKDGKLVNIEGKDYMAVKTNSGEKLILGQLIMLNGKAKFIPGQTITQNGMEKFVAGIVTNDNGKTKLLPGQVVDLKKNEKQFISGQFVETTKGLEFLPSKKDSVVNENGVSTLVPGQVVDLGNNQKQFVSGQFVETMKGLEFLPSTVGSGSVGGGAQGALATSLGAPLSAQTSQNVELQQVVNKMNPTQLQKTKVDTVLKEKAKDLPESMEIQEIVQNMGEGKVVKVAGKEFLSVKTSKGEKLLVGQYVNVNGKEVFVPGQTMTVNGVDKFVAGVVVNENGVSTLVPGQVVDLGNNQKQFVSGQFVETMKGLEFLPSTVGSGSVGGGAQGALATSLGAPLSAQTSQMWNCNRL